MRASSLGRGAAAASLWPEGERLGDEIPEHTREARAILGDGVLLAPEQKVVVESDPNKARDIGRPSVRLYLGLSNYIANLRRLGYGDDDLTPPVSDGLIDDLVAHGDAPTAAQRIQQHLSVGADHVPIQLVTEEGTDLLPAYRALAAQLL